MIAVLALYGPLSCLCGLYFLGLLLPERVAHQIRSFARTPGFSMIGLLVAWQVFPRLAGPLFGLVLGLLHPGATYRS